MGKTTPKNKKEEKEEVVESSDDVESDSESESEVEYNDDLKKELSSSLRFQSALHREEGSGSESEDDDESEHEFKDSEDEDSSEGEEDDSEDEDQAFFSKKMAQVEKSKKRKRKEKEEPASAWVDEDDTSNQKWDISNKKIKKARKAEDKRAIPAESFNERLRERYSNMQRADVSWATRPEKKRARKEDDDEAEEDDDDDLLRTTASLIEHGGKKKGIESGRISLVRVANANAAQPSHAVISALAFHPNQQIMLTAGMDKTLNLFHIDGQRNPKVQGVYVKDLPITSSFFCRGGAEVVMTGKRPFFYFFDLESGKTERISSIRGRAERSLRDSIISPDDKYIAIQGIDGSILVLCGISKQLLFTLQINGNLKSMAFSHDSTYLYASGGGGEVYEWDLRKRRCMERWTDEGSAVVSSLAASPSYLACGSAAGVVNLYKGPSPKGGRVGVTRTPAKTFMNLRTEIAGCAINKEEELMAFWSINKMNAVRLVHLPTMSVFSNFPAPLPPLGHPSKCVFSPNSGYFAVGNDFGKVLLYRIPHYGRA